MPRVVLDTNVLIAGARNQASASHRIVDACVCGDLEVVLSPAVAGEYRRIIPRAATKQEAARLAVLIESACVVIPSANPRVVPDDPDDDKFLAAALAGRVEALITNDRHILALDPYGRLRIVRPTAFVTQWLGGAEPL